MPHASPSLVRGVSSWQVSAVIAGNSIPSVTIALVDRPSLKLSIISTHLSSKFSMERHVMFDNARRFVTIRHASSSLGKGTMSGVSRIAVLILCCGSLCLAGCSGCRAISPEVPQPESSTPDQPLSDQTAKIPLESPPDKDSASPVSAPTGTETPAGKETSEASRSSASAAGDEAKEVSPSPRQSGDAESALKSATSLRDKAQQAAARQDYGIAFDHTSRAWESASVWPKDPRLTRLAAELLADLEKFGEQANLKFSDRAQNSSTKLIDK